MPSIWIETIEENLKKYFSFEFKINFMAFYLFFRSGNFPPQEARIFKFGRDLSRIFPIENSNIDNKRKVSKKRRMQSFYRRIIPFGLSILKNKIQFFFDFFFHRNHFLWMFSKRFFLQSNYSICFIMQFFIRRSTSFFK